MAADLAIYALQGGEDRDLSSKSGGADAGARSLFCIANCARKRSQPPELNLLNEQLSSAYLWRNRKEDYNIPAGTHTVKRFELGLIVASYRHTHRTAKVPAQHH
ncbi:hypothetical protein EDB19DRAFT_1917062 [Suillus lakei]|nr:hypothetical protein EDB19DRAFT_1917062 [Suillus lakei]